MNNHLGTHLYMQPFLESARRNIQARKRNPNPNFLVRISSGGVGVFHVKGGGQQVRYVLRNPGKPNLFVAWPGILPGYPGGARKFEKKMFVSNSSAVPKRGQSERGRTQKHANERKRAQISAKERKRKSAKERNRAQKGAKERKKKERIHVKITNNQV